MHGICNYIPETNHVYRVYSAAVGLYFKICAACNVIFHVESFVLLQRYLPKFTIFNIIITDYTTENIRYF